jgi:hypothetical protein
MESENTQHEQGEHEAHTGHHAKNRKPKWFAIGIAALIIVAIGVFLAWLYTGQLNEAKAKVFANVPLPAAIVQYKFIPASNIFKRFKIAEEVLGAEQASSRKSELQGQILERLVSDAQTEAQAEQLKLSVSNSEVEDQYDRLVLQLAGGDKGEFETAVKENYRLSVDEFKKEVIRPDILQNKLQVWFNSQKDLNTDIYKKTDEILSKVNNKENFGALAKQYSDDEGTKNLEGDAGTIPVKDMLPEFQVTLKDAKTDDVRQVTSRYGQHIIKVIDRDASEGEDNTKLHVQQIFVKQEGFADWYENQLKKIKVLRLIKFKV